PPFRARRPAIVATVHPFRARERAIVATIHPFRARERAIVATIHPFRVRERAIVATNGPCLLGTTEHENWHASSGRGARLGLVQWSPVTNVSCDLWVPTNVASLRR